MSENVILSPRGAARARTGHPWIYRADVQTAPASLAGGDEVRVTDARGNFIARAFWAHASPIALRLMSRKDEPVEPQLAARLSAALERRRALYPKADAFRWVHGEADLLPGYFVDLYGDLAAVQHLAEWADRRRAQLASLVAELSGVRAVVARDDGSSRDFEQLPRRTELLVGTAPVQARYHEGAVELVVDLLADHKTGGYLDQLENHVRAGELARGSALDCFCYHGGFALSMARRAQSVIAIDQDPAAAARTRENAQRNGLHNIEVRTANAIEQLRAFDQERRRFDTIVLDPPAFAKRRDGLESALRVYREINYRALRLLNPGGVLITCSCSGKVTPQLFGEMLTAAAQEAKRPVQILERRAAGADHPVLIGVPETDYLKTWVLLAP